jgi:hypothetical protein
MATPSIFITELPTVRLRSPGLAFAPCSIGWMPTEVVSAVERSIHEATALVLAFSVRVPSPADESGVHD